MIIESDRVMIDGVQAATYKAYPLAAGDTDPAAEIDPPESDILYLQAIMVNPDYRRRGIMRAVIEQLREQGRPIVISPVPLDYDSLVDPTAAEIDELRSWYRGIGFTDTGPGHLMTLL
ncbi:MAG: GNAT family N-acetyltransferase [Ilumatobacter sp.]|nr:GNAT family N-acetyltransferase [Ilumatobacter sp.]